jgi:hypothetical protein
MQSLKSLFSVFPDRLPDTESDIEKSAADIRRLTDRAAAGEALRIWYSEMPSECCGMCRIISELKRRMKKLPRIELLFLPPLVKRDSVLIEHMGWGDVAPEEFHSLMSSEEAGDAFIMRVGMEWERLQKENTALRAYVNGSIQSVEEDFYDCFIEREIAAAEPEFREASLIGNVLGKYRLGIGDLWLAVRIEKMIKGGRLSVVSEPEPGDITYSRILRKAKI